MDSVNTLPRSPCGTRSGQRRIRDATNVGDKLRRYETSIGWVVAVLLVWDVGMPLRKHPERTLATQAICAETPLIQCEHLARLEFFSESVWAYQPRWWGASQHISMPWRNGSAGMRRRGTRSNGSVVGKEMIPVH